MAISTAAAILGSAVIGGGAALLAGGAQADAASEAAGLTAQATRESVAEQRRQFDVTREDLAPYREIGTNALLQYGGLYGVGREGALSTEEMEEARARFLETPGISSASTRASGRSTVRPRRPGASVAAGIHAS